MELTGARSTLVYKDAMEDDPWLPRPYNSLAGERFGWAPKIALRDGLGRTIEYFRSIDFDAFRAPTPNY